MKKGFISWIQIEKVPSLESQKIILGVKKIFKKFNSLSIFFLKKVQFFESFCEEGSILWVMLRKKGFNSLSHIPKKSSILWVVFKKNSTLWVTLKKSSTLWVMLKKGSILYVVFEVFNSFSRIQKKCSILWAMLRKKSSILWVILRKSGSTLRVIFKKKSSILRVIFKKKIQFFESYSRKSSILRVIFKKKGSILWVHIYEKKKFNSLSSYSTKKRVQCFESCRKKAQIIESCSKQGSKEGSIDWIMFKRRLKSLSHVKKGSQVFESYKKGSILWVISEKKGSILCSVFEKERVQFFEQKKKSMLWITRKKVQFFGSCKTEVSILWVKFYFTRGSILCVMLYFKRSSILWVKESSILWVKLSNVPFLR